MKSCEFFDSYGRTNDMSPQKFRRLRWNFWKRKNDLYASGSKPGVLCGIAKIHKAIEDGNVTPSFCSIL